MDLTAGVGSTVTRNIADINGHGWDANIRMDWLSSNRISWNTKLLFSYNESTVADFHNTRSEEHTSELQSLMRISYAVFCLKKKKQHINTNTTQNQHQNAT